MNGIIAFHLGAGTHSEKNKSSYKRLCAVTAQKMHVDLSAGHSAVNIVTNCTALLENSPLTNAGVGSNLTTNGTVECDASVMDGAQCISGSVGAVSGVPNPVLVAKSLALDQTVKLPCGRTPPCMLVGEGALLYAVEKGIQTVDPSSLVTSRAKKTLKKCKRKLQSFDADYAEGPVENREGQTSVPIFTVEGYCESSEGGRSKKAKTSNCSADDERKLDTVGAVAVDLSGQTAASCSSGGILVKLPGRVGQAGVVGAGCWAEGPVAVTVSGNGEDLIRTSLCKEVARAMMASNDLASTLVQTITKLFLESKYLTTGSSKLCGVLAVKKDPEGGGELVWAHTTQSMAVGYISTNLSSPKFQISHLPKSVAPGSAVNVQGVSW